MPTGDMTTEFHTLTPRHLLITELSISKMVRKSNSSTAHG